MLSSTSVAKPLPMQDSQGTKSLPWLIAAALTLLTVIVFEPVRGYGFVNYDDGTYVTENNHVSQGLSRQSIAWAFSFRSCDITGNWHPLTWLSLMADTTFFGGRATGFHLVNLGIHVLNVLLLFRILMKTTAAIKKSGFVAAVFAIHPLHVESVVWISERKDVLSTFFIFVTILLWLRYVQSTRKRWYILSLGCFVLSLLAKQMYVTLPILLLLLDYWPLRRVRLSVPASDDSAGSDSVDVRRTLQRLAIEKIPVMLVAAAFCAVAFLGQKRGGTVGTLTDFPILHRCLNAVVSYAEYLWQSVYPISLAIFYPYPTQPAWGTAMVAAALLIAITVVALRWRLKHPYFIVGWLWYVVTLVPVIGLVQIGRQRMADRYMYFPLIGLVLACTWLASSWGNGQPRRTRLLITAGVLMIAILAAVTRWQTTFWSDSLTLFSRAAAVAESSLSCTKIGYERAQLGELDGAALMFRRALRIDPNYVSAHNSLGNTFLARGEPTKAIGHFQKAIELDPDFAESHYNLGIIHSGLSQFPLAITHYRHALRIDPKNAQVHTNLAIALAMIDEKEKAYDHLESAIQLEPASHQARFTIASLLAADGRDEEAISHFRAGLKSQPNSGRAHEQLARLYEKQGNLQLAQEHEELARASSGGGTDDK